MYAQGSQSPKGLPSGTAGAVCLNVGFLLVQDGESNKSGDDCHYKQLVPHSPQGGRDMGKHQGRLGSRGMEKKQQQEPVLWFPQEEPGRARVSRIRISWFE